MTLSEKDYHFFWDKRFDEQTKEAKALAAKPWLRYGPPIPFGQGRPEREAVINSDDVLNVKIALETCESVERLTKEI